MDSPVMEQATPAGKKKIWLWILIPGILLTVFLLAAAAAAGVAALGKAKPFILRANRIRELITTGEELL